MLGLLDADLQNSTLIFTSGCTEANNTIIKGVLANHPKAVLITTPIEHDSVLNVARSEDYIVEYLKVDKLGYVDEQHLRHLCRKHASKDVVLVSIIAGQNEIGTIQPCARLLSIIRSETGALVHIDATQLIGKYAVSVRSTLGDPDFVTGSAHKFHGPKGVGFLYTRDAVMLPHLVKPLIHGGGQEMHMRSGTENVAGIVGMVYALGESMSQTTATETKVRHMRDWIYESLVSNLGKNVVVPNGDLRHGLYNTLNITVMYTGEHNLAWLLDAEGICVSSASACTKMKGSHVLKIIGVSDVDARKTIRISLSGYNTQKECEAFVRYVTWLYFNVLNK